MFCKKCGNEVSENIRYCTACGSEINVTNCNDICGAVQLPVQGAEEITEQNILVQNSQKKKKKIIAIGAIIAIVIVIFLIVLFIGSDPVDKVKNGALNAYPEQTVGEAFSDFFSNPKWTSYEADGETYVKFTGNCTLYGEPVKAKIVFLIDGEEFSIDTCKIGNVSVTNRYELEAILDVIYE